MPRLAARSTILSLLAASAVAATSVLAWDWYQTVPADIAANPTYVGRETCAKCHQPQYHSWLGSDHERAMDLATEKSVEGDFNDATFEYQSVTTRFFRQGDKFMVNTEGPDGQHQDFEVKYTFGVRPLQQYMVEFPDGRVQVLREAWDVNNKKWFYVTPPDVKNERILPGDPLHWTGITQNWNSTCADCHSTNIHKNYDLSNNTYHTSWTEINVGCEECHGPGSVHVALAQRWSPFWDRNIGYGLPALKDKTRMTQLETCAKCHARRYQIHEDFRAGRPLLDYYQPTLLDDGVYQPDGQILDEVYEYDSFLQSKMHANHVRCTDCHDPHSLKPKFAGNALCTQCHEPHDPAKYDTPAHHHHDQGTPGAQCINCHMATHLYMVIDERRDHSFRIPRPDLSVALGTSNACNNCHTKPNETAQWAADAVKKWYGEKPNRLPHWAPAIAAGRASKPEGEKLLLDLLAQKQTPPVVRATAIDLLQNYNSTVSVSARREALHDSDPQTRLAAVHAIPEDNLKLLVADLASVLQDPIRAVRIAAAARLVHLPLEGLTDNQHAAFEKAFREFREGQELSLDHAGGHLVFASLAREQAELAAKHRNMADAKSFAQQAINHLTAAIQLEPYQTGPRAELASLLEETEGDAATIRRLRTEETKLLARDATIAPTNAEILYRFGRLHYLLGDLSEAETTLIKACELAPRNYEYRYFLALLQQKRYQQSGDETEFNAAVLSTKALHDLDGDDPRAKTLLEELLGDRNQKESDKQKK